MVAFVVQFNMSNGCELFKNLKVVIIGIICMDKVSITIIILGKNYYKKKIQIHTRSILVK